MPPILTLADTLPDTRSTLRDNLGDIDRIGSIGACVVAVVAWFNRHVLFRLGRGIKNVWLMSSRIAHIEASLNALTRRMEHVEFGSDLSLALAAMSWNFMDRPIWHADSLGNVILVNSRLLHLLTVQEEQVLGSGWLSYIHECDRDRVRQEWERTVAAGREFSAHLRLIRPDQQCIDLYVTASVIRTRDTRAIMGWTFIGTLTG